ncbi:hypothetical protein A6E15_09975 [Natrinema saccharevitans]|uniref:DUF2064 domain-containing protein n=1 Tax=Natrinema saccharevitans TaxID=301967 RepID=A0A1S8AXL3_9EURY|nr:hypothetical protein [Natrinema saccharevitans]OLZ41296.1 hypothetical protein A6E15_09975 [Natrinema saccharevitans]
MIVVVPVDPPRDGLVLPTLSAQSPLTDPEAATLYEAAVADVCRAVAASGGDLLVNYRDAETLPDGRAHGDPEADVRALVRDGLGEDADVRFERQVGSTRSARVGNTVSHLLEQEGAQSVGVLEPAAPLVARTEIDGAAMSLRRDDVVLGPSTGGCVYFAGFSDPIDFADAYAAPELSTLARRGADAGLGVGFAPMLPTIRTPAGLCETIAGLEARRAAGRAGGEATAAFVGELGLRVGADGGLERE